MCLQFDYNISLNLTGFVNYYFRLQNILIFRSVCRSEVGNRGEKGVKNCNGCIGVPEKNSRCNRMSISAYPIAFMIIYS